MKIPIWVQMLSENDSELDFESWMVQTIHIFSTQLTGEEKMKFLNHLMESCTASEIHEISVQLPALLYRDFIALLPTELSHILLSYFDVKTLLTACQVCRNWNSMICGNWQLWRWRSRLRGFRIPEEQHEDDASFYKKLFLQNSRIRWWKCSWKTMADDEHGKGITALYYYNGMVATGADDRTIRIWDCKTEDCLSDFTTHSTSALKFDDRFLVTASFDRTAALWDVRTGQQLRCYVGHTAAVFCVDFDVRLDVLVTGSADGTLKLWSFSRGELLRTLQCQNTSTELWISSVRLFCDTNRLDRFSVLASNEKSVFCWTMNLPSMSVSNFEILFDSTTVHDRLVGWDLDGSSLSIASQLDMSIPSSNAIRKTSYEFSESTAGRFVVGKSCVYSVAKEITIYSYLGRGKCFSAFLAGRDDKVMLCVMRRNADIPPVLVDFPPKCRPTRRAMDKTITLCDRRWMDGLSGDIFGELLLAAVFWYDSVRVLKFGSEKLE